MAIDHLLVDLEPPTLWVKLQEAPSNVALRQAIVSLSIRVVRDANTARFLLVQLKLLLASLSQWFFAQQLTLTPVKSTNLTILSQALVQVS